MGKAIMVLLAFAIVTVVDTVDVDEFFVLKGYCHSMRGTDIYRHYRLDKKCHVMAKIFGNTVSKSVTFVAKSVTFVAKSVK